MQRAMKDYVHNLVENRRRLVFLTADYVFGSGTTGSVKIRFHFYIKPFVEGQIHYLAFKIYRVENKLERMDW
jgi:hypothetical protein